MSNFTNKLKEKLPDILMATGILGHVGGLVLGCVATTKVPDIMDEYRAKLAEAALIEDEDERKKAIRKVKGWLVWQMTKNYAGTAAVEGLSIASELGAYTQVKKTCAELAVTVGVLDGALKAIKERTTDEVGAEKADDIWLGGKNEVTEPEEKNENGEVVKEAKTEKVYDTEMPSPYAVWFTPEDFTGAELSDDYNGTFLRLQEDLYNNYINHGVKLILWNDCLKAFGKKKLSAAGNHVGWVYDKNATGKQIDFRARLVLRRNENGDLERCWLLDPNVIGNAEEIALERGYISKF